MTSMGKVTLYPPDTKAFLYYSMSPEKPRIAGELRLRVTSGNDPSFFESGSDLLQPDGVIWLWPLYSVSKFHCPLYENLREDRLISDDLDTVLAALPSKRHKHRHCIYTLNDTFIIDFSSARTVLFVITEQGAENLTLNGLFCDWRDDAWTNPYTCAYIGLYLLIYWLFSWNV